MKALNNELIFNSMSAVIVFKEIVQISKLSAYLSALLIGMSLPLSYTIDFSGAAHTEWHSGWGG